MGSYHETKEIENKINTDTGTANRRGRGRPPKKRTSMQGGQTKIVLRRGSNEKIAVRYSIENS